MLISGVDNCQWQSTSVILWLIFAAAGLAGSAHQCRYPCAADRALAAPGSWSMEGDTPTWQTIDQCCQLQDLVGAALSYPEEPSLHDPRHGILLLGDSVEAFTLRAMCSGGDVHLSRRNASLEGFWACQRGPYVVAVQAMAGVHPTGPWHLNVTGSPGQRLAHVTPSPDQHQFAPHHKQGFSSHLHSSRLLTGSAVL